MDQPMTTQESYVQRRQLFKDIWETSMHIDEKDEIMNKPKVVKTLRLDEVDKFPVGKTKKQRIKNLRHVCNKILDFCDRQEADDKYEQTDSRGATQPLIETKLKPKKLKTIRMRKKIMKTKSLFVPRDVNVARIIISEKEELASDYEKISSPTSPNKANDTTIPGNSTRKPVKLKSVKKIARKSIDISGEPTTGRRKIVKKKRIKSKKILDSAVAARGGFNWPDYDDE